MIYLDNSATTRPFDAVTANMAEIERETFGNPSSLHRAGILAERELEDARACLLSSIGAKDGKFIFTGSGTEANNLAILGTMQSRLKRTPKIITSKIEHPSVFETVSHLKDLGADCRFVNVDAGGRVDVAHFESLLEEDTQLVSIMTVNNEVGSVQDIARLVKIAKAKNPDVLFHTDAVQALGKVPLNVEETGVDLLSVSAHKINGPKGVGGLYIRKGVHVKPIMYGGGQEGGLRSGTQNVPGIVGFKTALMLTMENLQEKLDAMTKLRLHLAKGLSEMAGCSVITKEESAPHIVCASFPGLKSETLLHALEARGVYVSSGSACSSNKPQLSPTLTAMGKSKKEIEGAIRFSLGTHTTIEEIETALLLVKEALSELVFM